MQCKQFHQIIFSRKYLGRLRCRIPVLIVYSTQQAATESSQSLFYFRFKFSVCTFTESECDIKCANESSFNVKHEDCDLEYQRYKDI